MNRILLISDLPGAKQLIVSLCEGEETIVERISPNQPISHCCDLVVIEFTKQMLKEERYKLIFDMKSRMNSPVLAVLEEGSTRDKLNVLNFGADDYIEQKNMERDGGRKLNQLLRRKRIGNLMKEKNTFDS